MTRTIRWYWIPLIVASFVAAAMPPLLLAAPSPAPAPASAAGQAATEILAKGNDWDPSVGRSRVRAMVYDDEAQDLALSVATGFAGGFVTFLLVCGPALVRESAARGIALFLLAATAIASLSGFITGMIGFIGIVAR